jgi:GT2 family glycosyltransferase
MKSRLNPDIEALRPLLTRPARGTAPAGVPAVFPEGAVAPTAEPAPCVSIVIPHLSAPQLGPCLQSIFEHGAERSFEVVVVFDGSTEEEVRRIQAQYEHVRTDVLPRNGGFARACNAGARLARGRYLIFLNDDTTVTAGWLDNLVDFVASDPEIGIAGPKLLYPESGLIQHCGTVFNEEQRGEHIWRNSPADSTAAAWRRYYRAVTGACIIIEREFFLRLGSFDTRLHRTGGCEDTDLCFKALDRGKRVAYCPDSVVYHFEGASRGLGSASRPDEVYNQKLLRQRWSKYLTPDIAAYDLLVEIEADEAGSWPWLQDVPAEILVRQCMKLRAATKQLTAERHGLASERDAVAGECMALARERDGLAGERDGLAGERDGLAAERDGLAAERDGLAAERDGLAADRDALAGECMALAREHDRLRDELSTAEGRREEARAQIAELEREQAASASALATLQAETSELRVQVAERDSALAAAEASTAAAEAGLTESTAELAQLRHHSEMEMRRQAGVEFTLRGDLERLRRRLARTERQALEAAATRDTGLDAARLETERLQAVLRQREAAIAAMGHRLEVAEERAEATKQGAEAMEQRAEATEQRAEVAEQRAEAAEKRTEAAEQRTEAAEQRAEAALAEMKRRAPAWARAEHALFNAQRQLAEREAAAARLEQDAAALRHEAAGSAQVARDVIAASVSDLAAWPANASATRVRPAVFGLGHALWMRARRAGDRARDAQHWPLAAQHYRRALAHNPSDDAVWVQYGHALKETGRLPEAEASYRRALNRDPVVADTHLQLGHALKLQGRTAAAQAAYLRAFALDPALSFPLDELQGLGWSEMQLARLRQFAPAPVSSAAAPDHSPPAKEPPAKIEIAAAFDDGDIPLLNARAEEIYSQIIASLSSPSGNSSPA